MKKSGLADSPFFAPATSPSEPRQAEQVFPLPSERKSERSDFRSEKRTVSLPTKRRTKRYSFEFYEDQLMKLKQLKYQAEMAGESLTLSDIVRSALDLYLQEKNT